MKKLLFTLITTLFYVSLTYAQQEGQTPRRQQLNPEERAKTEVQRLAKDLTLDSEQQKAILNYLTEANKNQQKVFQEAGNDRQAAFEKIRAQREEQSIKIKSFLTEEQIKKYDEIIKQREANRPQRRQNN